MVEIDKIDRKILSILQGDGRIANVELAERIGLSPTSIGERLKRLQRDGFVEGYGARLNPHRLGLGLLVFVEVMLDKTTPDIFERFARAVQTAPEVLECHMVAGGFDYLVKAALWLVEEALNTRHSLENLMATVEELQAALDANTAATTAAQTAINSEITDLAAAVAALQPGQAVTQAQLDQLNTSTANLQAAVTALGADDTNPAAGV